MGAHICKTASSLSIAIVATETDTTVTDALRRAVEGLFRLDREIGRGGMGVVYLAYDEQLHRDVAIKTLPPHLAADAQIRSRFLREARTAAALSHPHIVPIYSAAERDAVVYFAMGYVEGESMAERMARVGPFTPHELLPLLYQLADALGYAHSRGVVHRDVKAENVLLDVGSGNALVTDFGIARVSESQALTATGTVLGTVHYMSPEQVTGDALDGRSDLYALGVLTFFALTGRFPFERSTASAVVVAQVNSPPPRLSSLLPACPMSLEAVVGKLLAKAPGDRYANAETLKQALQMIEGDIAAHGRMLASRAETAARAAAPMSSTEAMQVWSRAAELQAHTGVVVPPPSFPPRGNDAPVTSGYDAALVKASAVDAGIDDKYVERALHEKAQLQRVAVAEVTAGSLMQKKPNVFFGAPIKLEYESAFDGELAGDDFEEIAEEVRRSLGEMVNVSAVGRTLTINTATSQGRQMGTVRALQLHLASRNGRTQVRIYEDLTNTATQWFGGLFPGLGMGLGALVGGLTANATHSPPIVIAAIAAWVVTAYFAARKIYGRSARRRDAQLRDILKRVVGRAQELIEQHREPQRLR